MNSLDDLKYKLRHRLINKLKFWFRYPKYRLRYGNSLPNFYTTIDVNPKEINKLVYPEFFRDGRYPRIEDGKWDKSDSQLTIRGDLNSRGRKVFFIEDYVIYNSLYDHYVNGITWKNTEYYSIAISRIQNNDPWHGCSTEEDVQNRFLYLDDIYRDIKNTGYKSAQELGNHISEEITICIGRNGELFLDDGRHRFFISKILGLKSVPVWVLVRHSEWQKKRHSYFYDCGDLQLDIEDHPDLNSSL